MPSFSLTALRVSTLLVALTALPVLALPSVSSAVHRWLGEPSDLPRAEAAPSSPGAAQPDSNPSLAAADASPAGRLAGGLAVGGGTESGAHSDPRGGFLPHDNAAPRMGDAIQAASAPRRLPTIAASSDSVHADHAAGLDVGSRSLTTSEWENVSESRHAAPADPRHVLGSTRFQQLHHRLQQLGAEHLLLEEAGGSGEGFRFVCRMPLRDAPSYAREFAREHADPLRAMEGVVEEVERWQRGSDPVLRISRENQSIR